MRRRRGFRGRAARRAAELVQRLLDPHRGDHREAVATSDRKWSSARRRRPSRESQRRQVGHRRAAKVLGEKTMTKLMPSVLPLDLANGADRRLDVAAQHVDDHVVPELARPNALAIPASIETSGWTGIVLRPPLRPRQGGSAWGSRRRRSCRRSPFSTHAMSDGGVMFSTGTPFIETMRPRSIGTRSSLPPGTFPATKASKPEPPCPGCRGRRSWAPFQEAPRSAGADVAVDQRRGDQEAEPEPEGQERTGVIAPGRWMLASARRNSVERGRGSRRASAIRPAATRRSSTKAPIAAPI